MKYLLKIIELCRTSDSWSISTERFTERFFRWVAWKLPRQLVYWCAIRLLAHVTSGYWSKTVVPELTAVDALQRFEKGPGGV